MALTTSTAQQTQTLLAGLRSPMNHETGCLFAMFKCCCLLGRANAKPSSELVRTALQFLLTAENPAAHTALQEKLVSCSCRIYHSGTTPPATLQPLECLDLFIDHLCNMICAQLRELRPAKFRPRKPNRAARLQPWPNGLADLGLDNRPCSQLVDILLRWTQASPVGSQIFDLLGALSRFWNPFGEEVMASIKVIQHMRHTLAGAATFHEHPIPPMSADFFRRSVRACFAVSNEVLGALLNHLLLRQKNRIKSVLN
ncbi:hypothetical protein C8R43DRAFT_1105939 [Mycena crocata]|nr:hypothetical protein C8R43DRAFT_1105939 [Mycena crocata]